MGPRSSRTLEAAPPGPSGERPYGRLWRVTDGDGTADEREIVLRDLVAGHQVVRVRLDGTEVVGQEPFLTGVTPLDVTFDDGGAMYVADFTGTVLRVDRLAR